MRPVWLLLLCALPGAAQESRTLRLRVEPANVQVQFLTRGARARPLGDLRWELSGVGEKVEMGLSAQGYARQTLTIAHLRKGDNVYPPPDLQPIRLLMQPLLLRLETAPEPVDVFLNAPQGWKSLGNSSAVVAIPLAELLPGQAVTLECRAPGYAPASLAIPNPAALAGPTPVPWPPTGKLKLARQTSWLPWLSLLAVPAILLVRNFRRPPLKKEAERVGEWQKLKLLGEGGMASVYRAQHRDGRTGALKMMKGEFLQGPEDVKRFRREAQIYGRLHHPNLVKLLDSGEQDGQPWLVLELLEGSTLRATPMPLPGPQVAQLIAALAQALQYAHDHGVVHRDLKPENILMHGDGSPRLLDFGVARGVELTVATLQGLAPGTPVYMAPEQWGGHFSPASDQFSLGVLAYELLVGQLPFEEEDGMTRYQRLRRPPSLPATVWSVLARMLDNEPDRRFPSVALAGEQLRQALVPEDDADLPTLRQGL